MSISLLIENKQIYQYTLCMISRKIITAAAVLAVTLLPATALPFNSKLSESDRATLENGEVLIKSIDKFKNAAIEGENPGIARIREEIKALDPNYLAEIIQIRPYEGNEDLMQKMREVIEDIPGYAGIQYWSVQHERYWDLYKSAVIVGQQKISDTAIQYNADLYMQPFGTIHSPILIEQTDDYLFYVSTNTNDLKFEGKMTCVKKNNMKSAILLFRDGDNWILYGLGGCKALKIAMFQERIERSFINRIKTFCNYVFTKI